MEIYLSRYNDGSDMAFSIFTGKEIPLNVAAAKAFVKLNKTPINHSNNGRNVYYIPYGKYMDFLAANNY